MEPDTTLFEELKAAAAQMDAETFAARHAGWYYLAKVPAPPRDRPGFATQKLDTGESPASTLRGADARSLSSSIATVDALWKVEKSEDTWARRISVGRVSNNDIVLHHHSISKLHAHFHLPAARSAFSAPDEAPFRLTDVGSVNGTEVNGEPLAVDAEVPVGNRDRITFGQVVGELVDALTLHAELASR